jgi:hypothetical protein
MPKPLVYYNKSERKTTIAKAYGRKGRWYGEHVRERIGNQRIFLKKNPTPCPFECMLGAFPLAVWNFLFPKEFVTIFGLG